MTRRVSSRDMTRDCSGGVDNRNTRRISDESSAIVDDPAAEAALFAVPAGATKNSDA